MRTLAAWLSPAILLLAIASVRSDEPPDSSADDEKTLLASWVLPDGPGLLKFFRARTGSDPDYERIEALIRQLGDDSFPVREKASAELTAVGAPALAALRRALDDPDEEIKERARECIAAITRNRHPDRAAAAARLLRVRRPAEAPAVLLAYLPFAESAAVEEEVLLTLAVLGVQEGKVDPVFTDALRSKLPERRAAAALVLGRSGTRKQQELVRGLLVDPDPRVRLRAAQGLIAGRDKSAVPALVGLLNETPAEVADQAEDLLGCLAGAQAPRVSRGDTVASRRKAQEAWSAWWKTHGGPIDLARTPVDLPAFNPVLRVREVGRQFFDALFRGDAAALRRTTDVPFTLGGEESYRTREQLDQFLGEIAANVVRDKVKITATSLATLDEYARTAPDSEKELVKSLSKSEVRVMYVQAQWENSNETVAMFIRVSLGQARVVGVGQGKPPEKR